MLIPRAGPGGAINIARPGGAGLGVPGAVCRCARPLARRLSLAGSAGATEREEGGRSERGAGRRRAARERRVQVCEARGVRGRCCRPPPPLPPSFPPSLPRPSPSPSRLSGAPAPHPRDRGTRPPALSARSRLAPRAPAAPPPGSRARSRAGGGGSPLDPHWSLTLKLRSSWRPATARGIERIKAQSRIPAPWLASSSFPPGRALRARWC